MTVPALPPAGWYPDPENNDGERYWSGTVWSEDRRARPARSAAGTEAIATAPPARKKHWRLGWIPLAEVVEELHSDDPATRIAAAPKLYAARRRDDAAERFEVEIACQGDPEPEVRVGALRVMASLKEDRKRLVSLLVSDQPVDAARKASVLAGIAELLGPDSPHHAGRGLQPLFLGNGKGVFDAVLREGRSATTTLPVLEVAGSLGLLPVLFTPWVHDPATTNQLELPASTWPDLCCACGRRHPEGTKPLPFSMAWEWKQEFVSYGTTTLTGSLSVPVCARCTVGELPSPQADRSGLRMHFASPAFVAELLEQGSWSASGAWARR